MTGMPSEHERYVNAWRDRRRRLAISWGLCLSLMGFYVIFIAMAKLGVEIDPADVPWAAEPIANNIFLLWVVAVIVIGPIYLYRFRCPRCGDRFFGPLLRALPFRRKCYYCSTPKGWLPGDKESM